MPLLTKDGRIPKNKWVVLLYSGGKILSRHQFKSAAMDRAIIKSSVTGRAYVVGEVGLDGAGKPVVRAVFVADRKRVQALKRLDIVSGSCPR